MSSIEDRVIAKIASRAATGLNKYGVTMDRTDLGTIEWLTHLQEELLDAAVYVEKLLEMVQLKAVKNFRIDNQCDSSKETTT